VSRIIALDFEFNRVVEPTVNLVCCATQDIKSGATKKFWLHKSPKNKAALADYLRQFQILIGYACVAEARSLLALSLDPLKWDWLDLFLEYRMLTNHNDDLQWGKQLVDGKVKFFKKPKPKWERTEEDAAAGFKATHSLAEATYKLTGEIRDTEHKTKMRDLIISAPDDFTPAERRSIMDYCLEDVVFLPKIWEREKEEFGKLDANTSMQEYFHEALNRGRYSAHTAIMEATGYPINVEATRNFSRSIPHIIMECQRDINAQFPDIRPFKWKKNESRFSWNQVATREWIEDKHDTSKWMKTNGGKKKIPKLSLSLDAFERFYAFKHSYPRGNFGAQMVRFLKLKQNLYGFSESGGGRKNFWDSVGSDGRVRPYMNIFGAQSGRSQPGASGFIFLKPAWMRVLVQPEPGRYIAGIDYGQQEFFLSALESEDQNMIAAYMSGDPYLYGAKLAGAIPEDGTAETHKIERNLFKNTYLGILYGMTKWGLAIKLTNDTGRQYDEEDAQEQIDIFEESFPQYMAWKEELMDAYSEGCGIRLPCGWRMWSDNDNLRSVCNVPIQGFGASVLRKDVDLAVGRGNSVIFTLHDATYIEGSMKNFKRDLAVLYKSMREAFQFYYKGTKYYDVAGHIKLDPFAWSPDFKKDSESEIIVYGKRVKVPCSNLYIDERSISEYERFKKYFEQPDTDLL
jgi:DNA polymerase-1